MATLEELIEAARHYRMSPAEREAQRRSFAYGNTHMANPQITREIVARAAERLAVVSAGGDAE
jgi:hypothetical protein